MSITRNSFGRPTALFAAAALLVGAAAPALLGSNQKAYALQLASRKIQMTDSAPSGGSITTGVGSGTAVSYHVTFTTSSAMQSVVMDFCQTSPLLGDATCTAPNGLNVSSATVTAGAPAVTWTPTRTANQVKLASSASVAASTVDYTLVGITNPTGLGVFYVRITTYVGTTWGTYSAPGTEGNYVDYGGLALSATRPIQITARVMESMVLCTSSDTYTGTACAGGATAPSVILGHSSNNILDVTAVDTKPVYSQVSTNAANGYAIYLRAGNQCGGGAGQPGGLSKNGGSVCEIPAVATGNATGAVITAGTAAFGAQVTDGTASSGGTGTNAATARWKVTGTSYIMDSTTATDNVGYTYGSMIASSAGQGNGVMNTITFGATASTTTPAGIYTENFSLVGVGTF